MTDNQGNTGRIKQLSRVWFAALLLALPITLLWAILYPLHPQPDYRDIAVEMLYALVVLVVYSMVSGLGIRLLQLGGGLFLLGIYMDALDDIFYAPAYVDIFICQGLQLVGVAIFAWSTYYNHSQLTRKVAWLREDLAQMKFRATHDPLTSLPNRLLLQDRLLQALAGAQRRKQQLALLYIDLDNMKEVNDNFGHATGDHLLNEIAQRLRSSIRESDTIARLGGDEFIVIQTDISAPEDALKLATKLLEEIDRPLEGNAGTIQPGASAGISLYPVHAENGDDLLAKADTAMYRAKKLTRKPRLMLYEDVKREM
ncbi:MAG: GGDEF domain-containing protein [Gammaproteobacteria bacterium]|nr:GGDEF domain-containing protein [Gammaproteobacteria bacterium]